MPWFVLFLQFYPPTGQTLAIFAWFSNQASAEYIEALPGDGLAIWELCVYVYVRIWVYICVYVFNTWSWTTKEATKSILYTYNDGMYVLLVRFIEDSTFGPVSLGAS